MAKSSFGLPISSSSALAICPASVMPLADAVAPVIPTPRAAARLSSPSSPSWSASSVRRRRSQEARNDPFFPSQDFIPLFERVSGMFLGPSKTPLCNFSSKGTNSFFFASSRRSSTRSASAFFTSRSLVAFLRRVFFL